MDVVIKTPIAKKEHHCSFCQKDIEIGEKYISATLTNYKRPSKFLKSCFPCEEKMYQRIKRLGGDLDLTSKLR